MKPMTTHKTISNRLKRVFTGSAILGVICSSAFASGSPLFKFDHESNGVNQNTEVRSGIANPSRVGGQKGANLSATDFLFVKHHEQKNNEKTVGLAGNAGGTSAQPTLQLPAGSGVSEGTWGDGYPISASGGRRYGHFGNQASGAGLGEATAINPTQLSYGNLKTPSCTAAEAGESEATAQANVPAQNHQRCGAATVLPQPGCSTRTAAVIGGMGSNDGLDSGRCEPEPCARRSHRQPGKTLTASKIVFNKPDVRYASIGRPALYLSPNGRCSKLQRSGISGSKGFATPKRVGGAHV
jgi:hypothetical protein